jgi:hypothetical protein
MAPKAAYHAPRRPFDAPRPSPLRPALSVSALRLPPACLAPGQQSQQCCAPGAREVREGPSRGGAIPNSTHTPRAAVHAATFAYGGQTRFSLRGSASALRPHAEWCAHAGRRRPCESVVCARPVTPGFPADPGVWNAREGTDESRQDSLSTFESASFSSSCPSNTRFSCEGGAFAACHGADFVSCNRLLGRVRSHAPATNIALARDLDYLLASCATPCRGPTGKP